MLDLPCTVEHAYGILESNENEYGLVVKEGNNMLTIVKIVISGIIVGAVNLVARYNPSLGGWLAAMPFIILLSSLWLFIDKQTEPQLTGFFIGVLWGLIPTAILVFIVLCCLQRGAPFLVALGVGLFVWSSYLLVAQRLGGFGR